MNNVGTFREQEAAIKTLVENLLENQLIVDPFFKADNDIILNLTDKQTIQWKRPKELLDKPVLGISQANFKDVLQGRLDNCALISAFTSLALNPLLLQNIFGSDYELYGDNYKGLIKINLWVNGFWEPIYVDDLLPTINGKLYFSRSRKDNHFWVALLEKAFAKLQCGYHNLIGIDSAFAIQTLTSGLILRLNPSYLSHKEAIISHLERAKEYNFLFCIIGSDLQSNENDDILKAHDSSEPRVGHSFSVVDIVRSTKSNQLYLKLRNSQVLLKFNNPEFIFFRKFMDSHDSSSQAIENEQSNDDVFFLSIKDLFKFYEILSILVIDGNKMAVGISISGEINSMNSFSKEENHINYMEKYVNCSHYIIEIKEEGQIDQNQYLIEIIFNVTVNDHSLSNYTGIFFLPICERQFEPNDKAKFSFIDFNLQKPTLSNANPYSTTTKLKRGRYLVGILFTNSNLSKSYMLRIAKLNKSISLKNISFEKKQTAENVFYILKSDPEMIKLVMAKCCVCESILDQSLINSGTKTYCKSCYNMSFKCQICSTEVGEEYYTVENRLICEYCLNKLTKQISDL